MCVPLMHVSGLPAAQPRTRCVGYPRILDSLCIVTCILSLCRGEGQSNYSRSLIARFVPCMYVVILPHDHDFCLAVRVYGVSPEGIWAYPAHQIHGIESGTHGEVQSTACLISPTFTECAAMNPGALITYLPATQAATLATGSIYGVQINP